MFHLYFHHGTIHIFLYTTYNELGDFMNYLKSFKKYSISFLIFIGIIFIFTFFLSIFHYFDVLSYQTVSIAKMIILLVSFFGGGFFMSVSATKKGWLEGIKFALIVSIFLLLFQILGIDKSFQWKDLIFYLILFMTAILGGMIGIHFTFHGK